MTQEQIPSILSIDGIDLVFDTFTSTILSGTLTVTFNITDPTSLASLIESHADPKPSIMHFATTDPSGTVTWTILNYSTEVATTMNSDADASFSVTLRASTDDLTIEVVEV